MLPGSPGAQPVELLLGQDHVDGAGPTLFEPRANLLLEGAGVKRSDVKREEVDALGHGLAYKFACSVIESSCVAVDPDEFSCGGWWNIRDVGELAIDDVKACLRYLEMRGLVRHHPHNAQLLHLWLEEMEGKPK